VVNVVHVALVRLLAANFIIVANAVHVAVVRLVATLAVAAN
jgi:hypothetical protein